MMSIGLHKNLEHICYNFNNEYIFFPKTGMPNNSIAINQVVWVDLIERERQP